VSTDADDYREYLKKYPDGQFAGLARNKIRNLEAAAKSGVPTSNPPTSNPVGTQPTSSGAGKQENVDPQTYTETVNAVAIEMVRVPSGKFEMGSPDSETGRQPNEGPQHNVSISSFYMGKYEVTQAQWRAVASLPIVRIGLPASPSKFQGDNLPVEQVSWDEATEFCERLSRATGKTYRLPTEAEWEYAARAMTTGPYAGNLDTMGWYASNSGDKTHPVGAKQANGYGLYDMHGNVWEWCQDWYRENYYAQSPGADPTGPGTGSERALRGGSWGNFALNCRSAIRLKSAPDYRINILGFRLVRTYN